MSDSEQRAGADEVGRSCAYCRFSFKGGVAIVSCPSCKAVHHGECWEENTGCAVLGCEAAPSATPARPAAPVPPPGTGRPGAAGPPAPAPPPPTAPRPPSPLANAPSAAEVAQRVRSWASTPVVSAAGLAGALAAAITVAVALVVAIITPASSAISFGSGNLFKETMRLAVSMTMARFGSSGFYVTWLPMVFVVVPIAASAFAAARASTRTAGLPVNSRLIAGVAGAVPFAVLLLVVGALGREDGFGPSAASVLVLSLLWGSVGGLIGAARATGPGTLSTLAARVPPGPARYLAFAWLALRPLAILLALTAAIGIAAWSVQTLRGEQTAKAGRSTVHALIENPLFAGEYAVGIAALGSMAQARVRGEDEGGGGGRSTPLPLEEHGDFGGFSQTWRIFAFGGNWAPFTFVLLLMLAIGLPLALAGYAGYVIAHAAGARTPALGVAHGAIVGVVWAFAMVLLRWIGNVQYLVGDSVFVFVLLTAGVAGALGGLIASRGAAGVPAAEPPALADQPVPR